MITAAQVLILATTLLFVAVCVMSDLRTRRIPNVLTGPAILSGFALNLWAFGSTGAQASVAGFGLAILILIAPFAAGGVGGGDVKMMAAVGAFLGPHMVLLSLLFGIMLGGVFAAVHLARIARLREKLTDLYRMIANATLSRSLAPLRVSTTAPGAVVLPYSIPLGLSTLCVIVSSLVR
jgi:prepilin peptidase CpaA